ncbi:unnamed protein product [Ciceribacter sp. T2.26MG-112.2]|uniref:DMT family transporter n=1 Tax=Ciceribacter sp. T2.26MG-112.2 TaxID=3137154 RepID=UPI000E17C743|nr:DMT family transporter [Ciceribacter naphthalenivorans]SSC73970.1 unnamed protein product [Ciceribacter naphthalenivorans]
MKPKDLAVYVFLAVAWGLSFLLVLKIVAAFGWVGAVTFRSFIAGITLFLLARVSGRSLTFRAGWWPFAVVGATTVAGQLMGLSYATPLIGTAMAAILVATIPMFAMVIGQLLGLERITPERLVGLVIGFVGVVLLVGFPAVPVDTAFVLGCAGALFACVCAAFGSNYASHRLKGTGAWEVTIGAFLMGGLMTLPLLFVVPVPDVPRVIDYGYLLIAAVVMSAMTYVLYFGLVASIGATRAISVEFAVTAIAVLVGAVFLGEPLSIVQMVGAVVIIAGCAVVLGLVSGRKVAPLEG